MFGITELTYIAMIAFLIVVILGPIFLPMLRRFKFGQTVRDDGPQSHLQKNGTPTMGGVMMIIAILITGLTRAKVDSDLLVGLICITGFGFVGFLDDFIKIKMKRSLGPKAYQKIILQFALAFFVSYYQYTASPSATQVMVPFTDYVINLGPLYVPIMMFIIIGTVNAVNLTDGLDGLAGGLSLIAFLSFGIITWGSTWIEGYQEIAIFCFILVGSILGFLIYNTYPAKVFMGDTGSLSLGATLAAVAILTEHELSLAVIGGVFVIEALSSIIQLTAIKKFGKKVFLMTPIHHHFEKLGWVETDIVKLFWVAGLVLAMSGIIFGVWL